MGLGLWPRWTAILCKFRKFHSLVGKPRTYCNWQFRDWAGELVLQAPRLWYNQTVAFICESLLSELGFSILLVRLSSWTCFSVWCYPCIGEMKMHFKVLSRQFKKQTLFKWICLQIEIQFALEIKSLGQGILELIYLRRNKSFNFFPLTIMGIKSIIALGSHKVI